MANPLEQLTEDQRDVAGENPLRRVYIYGDDQRPEAADEVPYADNYLTQRVAPQPGANLVQDVLALVRQAQEYLTPKYESTGGQRSRSPIVNEVFDTLTTDRPGKPRLQLWPERMVRSGLTLPGDVMSGRVPVIDPETGRTSSELIERAQDTAGLAVPGALIQRPGTATLGSGPVRTAKPEMPAPVFYSALEHAATNAAQDTMSPQQWLGWLKNQPGVKGEELAWTGLGDWLGAQKGKVSKADVQRYLDEHKVEIKDATKGKGQIDEQYLQSVVDDYMDSAREQFWDEHQREPAQHELNMMRRDIEEDIRNNPGEYNYATEDLGAPKYSGYQLPGGENYREHLLTLPSKSERGISEWYRDSYRKKQDPETFYDLPPETQQRVEQIYNEAQKNLPDNYKSSHWDEPNVLAHVRTNDRDVGGVPSLHIEEIQSDWHQQGRRSGYGPTDDPETWTRVPDAPFKTSWAELALKRMVRMAAEEGKTRVSWTPGEAQAARYDLSKHYDSLELTHNRDGVGELSMARTGGVPHIDKLQIKSKDDLVNAVGKDLADKLYEQGYKNNGRASLEGVDLKVGGEGMKGFYDNMLPKMVEKLGKAHGVKVKKDLVPVKEINRTVDDRFSVTGDKRIFNTVEEAKRAASEPVYYFDIPPAWSDQAVSKGFPLFMSGIPFPLTPVDFDPFKKDR